MPMTARQLLFQWRVYKALHPLLKLRKLSTHMIDFIKSAVGVGPTLAVDSFPLQLKKQIQIDKIIELTEFKAIWQKLKTTDVTFVDSLDKITNDHQYANIILTGLAAFKYKSVKQCTQVIVKMMPLLASKGNLIVALPITCLIFHRLKYSYNQIIDQLDAELDNYGLAIDARLLDIDIFYLRIIKL